jgi:hypothetical protein
MKRRYAVGFGNVRFVALALLLVLLVCNCASALDYLLVKSGTDPVSRHFVIYDMFFTLGDNPFYVQDIEAATQKYGAYSDTDRLVFYDRQGNILLDKPVPLNDVQSGYYGNENVSRFYLGEDQSMIGSLKIFRGNDVYYEHSINFCDKDGVCDACLEWPCDDAESFATCTDCSSGSADSYCDLERDGICDPDCGDKDGDCPRCGSVCLYYDMKDKGCKDIGGTECNDEQECMGGDFVYLNELMRYCCMGGRCLAKEEYVETMIELQNQPSLTITPNGAFASSIQEQGIGDYCHKSLKGMNCEPNQLCNGTEVQYYQDVYCCIGICVTPEDVIFPEIVNKTVTEEAPVEDINAFIERDRAHFEIEQQMTADEPKEKLLFAVEKVVPKIPPQLKGSSLPVIVGSLLAVLLVVTVIVALFRRSAAKTVQAEQKVAEPVQDIQQTIDSMVSKGFNYAQVRDYLLQQGVPQDKAVEEIRKNYDSRKSSQLK